MTCRPGPSQCRSAQTTLSNQDICDFSGAFGVCLLQCLSKPKLKPPEESSIMSTSPANSRFPFLLHEGQIGKSVGHAVPALRVFTLEGLGIDKDEFLSFLRPTFSLLHIDQYDPKRNRLA